MYSMLVRFFYFIVFLCLFFFFFFSSRRRHTRLVSDWSSDVCSSDLKVFGRIEEAIEWADVLNVLRLQLERMEKGFIPSVREYYRVFGVTPERLERSPKAITIMHPGPMNRGVEIDSRVADGPHSVILD